MPMNRKQLILEYWPLAKGIAYNTCSIPNLREECQSVATEALIDAIDSIDSDKAASLKTWITINIKLSVIRFINKQLEIPICENIDDVLDNRDRIPPGWIYRTFRNTVVSELIENSFEDRICAKDLLSKIFNFIHFYKGNRKRKNEVETLFAYCFEGYLQKEIAEWRRCKVPNISRMISQLKNVIFEEFGEEV